MDNELVILEPALTPAQFAGLADVPPELEWLAHITNLKTRRAYKIDVAEFSAFAGLREPTQLRTVMRVHVIAWRKSLESRNLTPASIRRKLSALSSLYEYLCERNAVLGNPMDGVKRPAANSNEGSTPALGDAQAQRLLEAPPPNTLKGVRDRAILATPSITASAAKNYACCACVTCKAARAACICASKARETRSATSLCIRWPRGLLVNICNC